MSGGLFSLLSPDEVCGAQHFHVRRRNPSMFGPSSPTKVKFQRGLMDVNGRVGTIARLLAAGNSNKQICRTTGYCMQTIAKVRHVIETERGKPILCQCGQRAGHNSYCPVLAARREPGTFVLTPELVRGIRAAYIPGKTSFRSLGRQFSVSAKTISRILSPTSPRPIWRHIK